VAPPAAARSDALLAGALQYVDVPGYAALILRRTFRQLDQPDAIMARSKEWLMPHRANGVRWNDDAKRWTFPSGATLTFGYLEHYDDVYNYQGAAYQFVGWDELTQFDEKPYEYLFSRTRRNKDLLELGIPIRHRSASNPGGVGHAWVQETVHRREDAPEGRVFMPAKVDDNPGLDVAEYKATMLVEPRRDAAAAAPRRQLGRLRAGGVPHHGRPQGRRVRLRSTTRSPGSRRSTTD
jgi:hypothetical protein